jgi:hypothetical protein
VQPSSQSKSAYKHGTGDIAPGGEGAIAGSPILTSGEAMTAELEVAVDRRMSSEKLLGVAD